MSSRPGARALISRAKRAVAATGGKGGGCGPSTALNGYLNEYLDWLGLGQVCCVERTRRRKGKETVERAYAITSLPPERADAARLLEIWRGHWGIENRLHWVRDVVFGEDLSQVRTGSAPQLLAALRNLVIGMLRLGGVKNISAAPAPLPLETLGRPSPSSACPPTIKRPCGPPT